MGATEEVDSDVLAVAAEDELNLVFITGEGGVTVMVFAGKSGFDAEGGTEDDDLEDDLEVVILGL